MAVTISGNTGVAGVDGSAGTPALQGTDTNTGIAFPAADTVTIATGGSERMRVDSSGNVGIANASPTEKLDVTGNIKASGTITSSSTVAGSTGTLYPLVSGTVAASTSGTNVDFTGIPSWVKRVTLMLNGVSTNGSSGLLVRLGTSGGFAATGYISTSVTCDSSGNTAGQTGTTGFGWYNDNAAYNQYGTMTFYLVDAANYIWVANHTGRLSTGNNVAGGGGVTLSGALTQLRLTTVNGTDAFDAGSINILYE